MKNIIKNASALMAMMATMTAFAAGTGTAQLTPTVTIPSTVEIDLGTTGGVTPVTFDAATWDGTTVLTNASLGNVCFYTNHPDSAVFMTVTNSGGKSSTNPNKFLLKNADGKSVEYSIRLNSGTSQYDLSTATGGNIEITASSVKGCAGQKSSLVFGIDPGTALPTAGTYTDNVTLTVAAK